MFFFLEELNILYYKIEVYESDVDVVEDFCGCVFLFINYFIKLIVLLNLFIYLFGYICCRMFFCRKKFC